MLRTLSSFWRFRRFGSFSNFRSYLFSSSSGLRCSSLSSLRCSSLDCLRCCLRFCLNETLQSTMNKTENAKTSGALLECGTNNTLHALSDDFCKQKLLITYSLFELKDESMSKKVLFLSTNKNTSLNDYMAQQAITLFSITRRTGRVSPPTIGKLHSWPAWLWKHWSCFRLFMTSWHITVLS